MGCLDHDELDETAIEEQSSVASTRAPSKRARLDTGASTAISARSVQTPVKVKQDSACLDSQAVQPGSPKAENAVAPVPDMKPVKAAAAETESDGEDLPINKFSIDAKFPVGNHFTALSRIRHTTNEYCKKLAEVFWFEHFKVPTMKALLRRMVSHESAVVGTVNVDCDLAFRQLKARLEALVALFKTLYAWNQTTCMQDLAKTLVHFDVLERFLSSVGMQLAPDLMALRIHARFYSRLGRGDDMTEALGEIDLELLAEIHQQLEFHKGNKPVVKKVKAEGGAARVKAEPVDDEDKNQDLGRAFKKGRTTPQHCSLKYDVFVDAPAQISRMLAEPLKRMLHELPKGAADDQARIEKFLVTWQGLVAKLQAMLGEPAEDDTAIAQIAQCVVSIVQCALSCESARPPTMQVRKARQRLFTAARSDEPAAEVAKAMSTYDGCQALMHIAKHHAAGGLQDDAADVHYAAAVASFEKHLGPAFDDTSGWLDTGNDGKPFDMHAYRSEVVSVSTTFAHAVAHSLKQWSSSALQRHIDDMKAFISVTLEVARIGMHVQLKVCSDALGLLFAAANPPVAKPSDTSAKGLAPGPVKEEPPSDLPKATSIKRDFQGARVAGLPIKKEEDGACPMSDWMSGGLAKLQSACSDFGAVLIVMVSAVERCYEQLLFRLGKEITDGTAACLRPKVVHSEIESNTDVLIKMCRYVLTCHEVQSATPLAGVGAMTTLDTTSAYYAALREFCRLHKSHMECAFGRLHSDTGTVDSSGMIQFLEGDFRRLVDDCGKKTFSRHSEVAVDVWILGIVEAQIVPNAVNPRILDDAATSVEKMVSLLVVTPSPTELLPNFTLTLTGKPDDDLVFNDCVHNKGLRMLRDFHEAVEFETIKVPGCKLAGAEGPGSPEMPYEFGFLTLGLMCLTRDLAVVASLLQVRLILPSLGEKAEATMSKLPIFGDLQNLVRLFQRMLSDLDERVHSHTAIELEKAGWQLPTAVPTMREWRKSLACLSSKCLALLMKSWVYRLNSVVDACRSACPAWDAIFKKGVFHEPLAKSLLVGKSKQVIDAHNAVHDVLSSMNIAAKAVNLSVRLSEHEASSASVAVALSVLAKASTTSVVCTGVELLVKYKHHPAGHRIASDFLAKHRTSDHKDIADAFWHQLENLTAHATAEVASAQAPRPKVVGAGSASDSAPSCASPSVAPSLADSCADSQRTDSCADSQGIAALSKKGNAPRGLRRISRK